MLMVVVAPLSKFIQTVLTSPSSTTVVGVIPMEDLCLGATKVLLRTDAKTVTFTLKTTASVQFLAVLNKGNARPIRDGLVVITVNCTETNV
jgi:hypothetical protein